MLRQLGELAQQHGVKLSQNYNMNSDYKAMKYEYELHRSIRDKHNGVKWLSNIMVNLAWGVELANENFNPFEFKLKGWSEQMNDDVDEYYDVLGELYEKYFKSGKPIPPELKLMLMVGGSAVKFHIAHTAINKIPSLDEALQRDPRLAEKLHSQAMSDKIKEQYQKQKEAFEKKSDQQHDIANKKTDDLRMLKEKELEFAKTKQSHESQFVQQQYMQQQQQEMMRQQTLQNQIMEQQSQQLLAKQKQLENLQKQLSMQRSDSRSMYSNTETRQKTMGQPVIPASIRNKMNLNRSDYDDNVSIHPDVDNLINDGFDSRSSESRSTKSRRPRKKPAIKIDT
jgi:myosin heavy subunit